MQCRTVTNQFSVRKLPVKLRPARGYFILEYTGDRYETKSVMINRLNQLSIEQWLEEANWFVEELKEKGILST
jgi:hypothetical protein